MKISSAFLVFLFIAGFSATSQVNELDVQGIAPHLYIVHTVIAKENWYSIGRMYNISPKEIAPFNNANLTDPLAIGLQLKIPLTTSNFSQDNKKAPDEVFIPVYYTVKEREWMYRISQNNNKVPIDRIQQWNHVTNGTVKPGMKLIVGFVKVKPAQSSLATTLKVSKPADLVVKEQHPEKKADSSKLHENETKKLAIADEHKTIEPENKKVEPENKEHHKTEGDNKTNSNVLVVKNSPTDAKGGYFRSQYGETGKIISGAAGVFRSNSGWQDGKYYALMNNVPVGTIIKVESPQNHRSVYAKVLGNLPDMKESMGLTVRISDAAATELGVALNKFSVDVKY